MTTLHELDVVRILKVSDSARREAIDAGDEAVIVDLFGEHGPAYLEKVAPDGHTEWLATFRHDEIEIVWCSVG
jgi:hypothetical protein